MATDPIARALKLRETLLPENEVMVVDFSGTLQGKDTSRVIDLMPDISNGRYVFRAKVNVKEIDPLASATYGKTFHDTARMDDEAIEEVIRRAEFDFPLWYKHMPGFQMRNAVDYNIPFLMQVAGCNFHDGSETGGCWYCFVDDTSNDGRPGTGKSMLTVEDAVSSMQKAREKVKAAYAEKGHHMDLKVFRVSGGEPTIALDWVLALWRHIGERGLPLVGQLDSNLSTAAVVERFERDGIYELHTLEKLAEFPVKVLTALKGVSDDNLESNVQSMTTMEAQMHSLKKFLGAGFDIYPQMYNPDPEVLMHYLAGLDDQIPRVTMRVHVGPLHVYGPTKARLTAYWNRLHGNGGKGCAPAGKKMQAMAEQSKDVDEFLTKVQAWWDDNYRRGGEIIDDYLRQRHGVGYKDVTRSDVPLVLPK